MDLAQHEQSHTIGNVIHVLVVACKEYVSEINRALYLIIIDHRNGISPP